MHKKLTKALFLSHNLRDNLNEGSFHLRDWPREKSVSALIGQAYRPLSQVVTENLAQTLSNKKCKFVD